MICPNCGTNNADGSKFCVSCGQNILMDNPSDAQQSNDYQQPNYQQPNYQQPDYQQPNYQQPDYQQPNYQQPNYQQQGGYKAPIQQRNIAVCIILSLVTCGIYALYWYFCIINDLNTASGSTEDAGAGKVLLLSIITCGIYSWIWLYKAGEKVDAIKVRRGEVPSNSSLLYILLAIFQLGIVDYCLIQTELNKVAAN